MKQKHFQKYFLLAIIVFLSACGGSNTNSNETTQNITHKIAVQYAIKSGDILNSKSTKEDMYEAVLNEISNTKNFLLDAKKDIFNLNSDGSTKSDGSSLTNIRWDPTHDASLLIPTWGDNRSLLKTNAVTNTSKTILEKDIALIGQKTNNTKYMVFGSNPMRNWYRTKTNETPAINEQMNTLLKRSINWLINRDLNKEDSIEVVISHMDDGYYFPDERAIRSWLDTNFTNSTYNSADDCDNTKLSGCIKSSTKLIIISQISSDNDNIKQIAEDINQAMKDGIPVLYLHHDGNLKTLGEELFSSVFRVQYESDNYWKKLMIEQFNASKTINDVDTSLNSIKTVFEKFKNDAYNFDGSLCDDKSCSDSLSEMTEFKSAAEYIQNIINGYDTNKKNIFEEEGYILSKLLVLTADKLREDVTYPMNIKNGDNNAFMKSYYSDYVIYNFRDINPVQKDMGNFSRSDFSHIKTTNKTINMSSRKYFKAAGVYALPGQSVKITRNDNEDINIKVFINTLRSGATHEFDENKYNRPKFLKSTQIPISSGESITLTSPYGGPIQLAFDKNDMDISLSFENIGLHPFWKDENDDASFANKMAAKEYDWAEISTSGFEVHSKIEKMQETIDNSKWGNAKKLAETTVKYTSNYPHVLAGFQGNGIEVVNEIHDFAKNNNLSINTIDIVKHMNADQATCGYGCSGNPYDAYWNFDPVGHGDIHELGHGLEDGRFKMEGWELHSLTNPYSYYTKSEYNKAVNEDTNLMTSCQTLPFKDVFDKLQASIKEADPSAYLSTNLWPGSWSNQVLFTIQAMMSVQKEGKLDNGWHLLARLHILNREYKTADNSEDLWNSKKSSLGFANYTYEEAKDISNNDWMLIAMSYSSGLDFRDYFSMWGLPYSSKASIQVLAFNYNPVPRNFFKAQLDNNGKSNGYCKTDSFGAYLDKESVTIDGVSTWEN